MPTDVAIIDYKISNMFSVDSACRYFGLQTKITRDRDEILNAKSAILPGVGAFGCAMEHLYDLKLTSVIREFIASGKPFMGICLGMQLLMSQSEEFGIHEGLNIIPGTVKKFPSHDRQGQKVRVPHMGWNKIRMMKNSCDWFMEPLAGIVSGEYMYFVHSFYVTPQDESSVLTRTHYCGIDFCSSLTHKNIFACQFHPEKSGSAGLTIFRNFSASTMGEREGLISEGGRE